MGISTLRTRSARDYHTQQEHYLYRRINFNTPQLDSTYCVVGVLPPEAQPLETIVRINTTWTSITGGIIVGTTADTDAYVELGDLVESTTGLTINDRCAGAAYSTAATTVVVRSSGATTGEADIWVRYLPAK